MVVGAEYEDVVGARRSALAVRDDMGGLEHPLDAEPAIHAPGAVAAQRCLTEGCLMQPVLGDSLDVASLELDVLVLDGL